jgi:hypothetical protein
VCTASLKTTVLSYLDFRDAKEIPELFAAKLLCISMSHQKEKYAIFCD